MWPAPFDAALAAHFREAISAGYQARCLSHRQVVITEHTVVRQLSVGVLRDCADLILCRNDLNCGRVLRPTRESTRVLRITERGG
eukprot:5549645-Prymnesium_polylepis.1